MTKPRNSVPFKVLLGYLLLTAFGAVTVWFIYSQTVEINTLSTSKDDQKKLSLISEVATRLYDTEGISRNIIQNREHTDLSNFNASIDTIASVLDTLKALYPEKETRNELDSINFLLNRTGGNLEELIAFRRKNASNNYYDRVLKRLEQADYLFGSTDYKSMVKDLKPYQQKVLVDFLEYAEEDNADRLTNRTADSLINTMKQVLLTLELNEHNYQDSIANKERKLLVTGIRISNQLRKIRNRVEQEGIQNSLNTVRSQQEMLHDTLTMLIVFGIASVITIISFIIIIVRDINKSRQYRLDLEKAKIYAESLLKSREQLMNTVTHDLRSPIGTIMGYSNLLNKTNLSNKQKVYARQLNKASDYTMRLVNDLLDFSRLDAGKISIEERPFVPDKLIRETLNVNIPSHNPKQLAIVVDTDSASKKAYLSDPFRLQQIVANLIGNAYKFTKEGSIKIVARIQETEQNLRIEVIDSGIGISAEQQKIIFNEFSQADADTEKRFGGSGLGLAITKKLTELLGGKIEVESKTNEGSRFILQIPVQQADKTVEKENEERYRLGGVAAQKVLLVDDDKAQLGIIGELLKNQGFAITEAGNGRIALEKIKAQNFDLVFTDIHMPEMTGFQLISRVREFKSKEQLPVIALSGESAEEKSFYLKRGFSDYLLKPYKQQEILKIIAHFLKLKLVPMPDKESKKIESSDQELFDLSDIKSFIGEDRDSLQTIIKSFRTDLRKNIQHFQELDPSQEEGVEEAVYLAHKMLVMTRQIKAETLIPPLEELERNAKELKPDQLKAIISQVLHSSRALLAELESFQPQT